MKALASFVLLGYLFASPAWAQCAAGVDTGGGNCVPPDAPGMPGYETNANQRQAPPPVWADRWGAIALDTERGDAGTVEGQESKAKAEKVALTICGETGAQHCKVILAFYNQCAAVAQIRGGGKLSAVGAATQKEAEQMAIAHCSQGGACEIVYSKCSLAERIR